MRRPTVQYFDQKGILHLLPLLLILLLFVSLGSVIVLNQQGINPFKSKEIAQVSPTPTPSPIPEPTPPPAGGPTSSPTPSPKPVVSPKPKPSSVATPKPATAPVTTNNSPGNGYSRITVATDRGNFTISVVTLNGATMVTDTASDDNCGNDCPTLSLADYVSRNGGFAGINGTYFCPASYPECDGKKDTFDWPVFNSRLGKWINEDKLFWDGRSMVYQSGGSMHFLRNANSGAGGPSAGIVNWPGLVDNGQVIADQYVPTDKQSTKGTKGGIGFSGSKVFLVIASGVDMIDFAHIFKSIGADYALNLDGGGSAALYYNGYRVGPGRSLPNAIIFK